MKTRPKDIGTATESAVVKALRTLGFPHAERRALAGAYDLGDITGCPGLVFEVKGGEQAKSASDKQIADWLMETETERINARADIGVLVVQRRGIGAGNAHRWWAVVCAADLFRLHSGQVGGLLGAMYTVDMPVRLHLSDLCTLLRKAGYGQPLETLEQVTA